MIKLALAPLLIAVACLVAGIYGAIHNQVSYTVSPDYFHAFKFEQFSIPESLQNRFGASLVGWRASWWMGIFIGTPLVLVAMVIPGWRRYLLTTLKSFAVVAATALACGLGALLYGYFAISEYSISQSWFPDGVVDEVAFERAGTMHNFSYLGGAFGILTGCIYVAVVRVQIAAESWRDKRPSQ